MRTGIARLLLSGLLLSGLLLLGLCVGAPRAFAQTGSAELTRAEQQLELAEFEEAARLLDEVADDSRAGLDRAGVARLLRLRAVVRSALGRDRDADRDLASLSVVLEGREPGPLPQSLRRRFDRLRRGQGGAALRVRVGIRPIGDADVQARVSADEGQADVVARTELSCSNAQREVASSDSGTVIVRGESELICEGRAYGLGGWRIGSSTARWRSGAPVSGGPVAGGFDDGLLLWAILGAGAAVLVGVLIAAIAVASSSSGVSGPTWVPRE